jgi:hypothetical protein
MVRTLLAEPTFDPTGMPEVNGHNSGRWLQTYAPGTVAWREFDHNAALTALYAAYECCIYDLLREWVAIIMPIRWPNYLTDLPDNTRRSYVVGIAKLLPKMGRTERNRYQHLNLKDVAQDFADTTAGKQPYRLHPDAFFAIDQNLRHGQIQDLFNSVGLVDAWGWICRHHLLIDYRENIIGGANTLENELGKFIQSRNDAAHGATGTYLGASELDQLAHFAERLGTALVEKARHDMYEYYLAVNQAESLGIVTEVLTRAKAVIVKATGRPITVGESLGFLANNSCDLQTLISCQIDNVDHANVVPVVDQEVGLRFAKLPREGSHLVRLISTNVS